MSSTRNSATQRRRPSLGELLVNAGMVTREQVELAAREALKEGRFLGEVLVDRTLLEQRDVYQQLARQRGLEFLTAVQLLEQMDWALTERLPRRFIERQEVVPICCHHNGKRVLRVATPNPDANVPELAPALDADEVRLCLVTPMDFRRLRMALDLDHIARSYAAQAKPPPTPVKHEARPAERPGTHPLDEDVQGLLIDAIDPADAGNVLIFEAILLDAIAERASDIHLERYRDTVRVRLRVDGDLHDVRHYHLTPEQLRALVNIVKVNARLDITEQRAPQGGRFITTVGGHTYDLRVQTQPSLHGEHVVLRLLPQDTQRLGVDDLGFPAQLAQEYRQLLNIPSGLVLVVGPSGSGKTTTLYAGLMEVARDTTRKVITIEDPIEYALDGVQQCQVAPEVSFHFANAMRVFVRQDPDVILLGEIRDSETALEALRASQTGHLVLATLHCNEAAEAPQRLIDLGMHPNSVASELSAVLAQRLAKRICPTCRTEVEPPLALMHKLFPRGAPAGFRAYRGRGCGRCGGLGTHGRIALAECLPAGPEVRRAISHGVSMDELRALAVTYGLVPMREQALQLVTEGIIPLEELPAVLPPERLAPTPGYTPPRAQETAAVPPGLRRHEA